MGRETADRDLEDIQTALSLLQGSPDLLRHKSDISTQSLSYWKTNNPPLNHQATVSSVQSVSYQTRKLSPKDLPSSPPIPCSLQQTIKDLTRIQATRKSRSPLRRREILQGGMEPFPCCSALIRRFVCECRVCSRRDPGQLLPGSEEGRMAQGRTARGDV